MEQERPCQQTEKSGIHHKSEGRLRLQRHPCKKVHAHDRGKLEDRIAEELDQFNSLTRTIRVISLAIPFPSGLYESNTGRPLPARYTAMTIEAQSDTRADLIVRPSAQR
jgi:hypothetical protein